MSKLSLGRRFAIMIPLIFGEFLFALGLASLCVDLAMVGGARQGAFYGLGTGTALLIFASRANPPRKPAFPWFFARPLALACLIIVIVTIRLPVVGAEPVTPTLFYLALVAASVGIGMVLLIRHHNSRSTHTRSKPVS